MANLTFTDLLTELYDHTGLDSTDTNNAIRAKRWLNYVQQDICARWPWNFLRSRESIVTVPDKTAGTVTINAASNTINGTSGTSFVAGDVGKYIQFAGANDWYKTTALNAGIFTLEQSFQGTATLTSVTYTLRQFFYSLSSSCDRIADVKNWNTPLKLDELFPRDVDYQQPNPQSTNTSYGFIPYGYDASNNVQIIPYPFPSDARLLEIKTFKRPTDMSGSTDLPTIPNKWAHIISFGGIALGFAFLRKLDLAAAWERKFEAKIKDMLAQERTSEDSSPVLRSIDASRGRGENWLQLPGQYPYTPGRP